MEIAGGAVNGMKVGGIGNGAFLLRWNELSSMIVMSTRLKIAAVGSDVVCVVGSRKRR